MSCGRVWIGVDCDNLTEISGKSGRVQDTSQTRQTGDYYTLRGENALIEYGKKEPLTVSFEIVYNDEALEAYETVRALWETNGLGCGSPVCVRWSPGGEVGDQTFSMGTKFTQLVEFFYPPLDAQTGGPIVGTFRVKGPTIDVSVLAT